MVELGIESSYEMPQSETLLEQMAGHYGGERTLLDNNSCEEDFSSYMEQRRMEISGLYWPGRCESIEGKLEGDGISFEQSQEKMYDTLRKEGNRLGQGFKSGLAIGGLMALSMSLKEGLFSGEPHEIFSLGVGIVGALGYMGTSAVMMKEFSENFQKNLEKESFFGSIEYAGKSIYNIGTSFLTPLTSMVLLGTGIYAGLDYLSKLF